MEALGIFKFWRNTVVRADAATEGDDEEETNNDDSLFDLEFKSPGREEHSKKDSRFIESPPDVFPRKNDFSISNKPARRSAQKFKVFVLGFKKSPRLAKIEASETRVLDRENSSRGDMPRENCVVSSWYSDKSVPKYLKLIKPFYMKASSKAKSADPLTPSSSTATAPVTPSPRKSGEVIRVGSFKIMTRSLGTSRSASTVDGAAPPWIRRRDESLLEQRHDGIEGAILHCKKSFTNCSSNRNSCEERKRCSI